MALVNTDKHDDDKGMGSIGVATASGAGAGDVDLNTCSATRACTLQIKVSTTARVNAAGFIDTTW